MVTGCGGRGVNHLLANHRYIEPVQFILLISGHGKQYFDKVVLIAITPVK